VDKYDNLIKSVKSVTPAPIFIGINSSRSPDDVPAKAGNHLKTMDSRFHGKPWIPASAGMTKKKAAPKGPPLPGEVPEEA